jgi:hypothetical protein
MVRVMARIRSRIEVCLFRSISGLIRLIRSLQRPWIGVGTVGYCRSLSLSLKTVLETMNQIET